MWKGLRTGLPGFPQHGGRGAVACNLPMVYRGSLVGLYASATDFYHLMNGSFGTVRPDQRDPDTAIRSEPLRGKEARGEGARRPEG